MQIFLLERIESSSGWLDPTETRHCIKVLRHKVGDEIWCIDGQGTAYQAVITAYDKEHTSLQLRQSYPGWGEHDRHIRLLVSPLRLRDRFEFMIEKAVELGVNEIVPISCQRTDKYQSKFKPSRIQTLIATASKQCKRSRLATLQELQPMYQAIETIPEGANFLAYCEGEPAPLQSYGEQIKASKQVSIMIGPEGDFTEEEARFAERQHFQTISLGENRLRTETAAIYALSVIKMLQGY